MYDSCVYHCARTNSSVNTAITSHESVQLYYHRTISQRQITEKPIRNDQLKFGGEDRVDFHVEYN